ncbi:hypothetical protein [Amycolatopsis minnesotensis]|uniref:Uncharacterized protein n=1 Tax=Amycolatopsis minnesotensis TaxID=337894 RepID=A0ABP5BXD3_9PSEU
MAGRKLFNLRARASERLARLVDFRISGEVDGLRTDLDPRLVEQEHCTNDHRRRLDALEEGLEGVRGDLRWVTAQVDRLIPHVAAQEGQLEDLREKIALVPPSDRPEATEARSLIEEVQRQHAQIRARLTGIARYEDRLRRLEDQASAEVAG